MKVLKVLKVAANVAAVVVGVHFATNWKPRAAPPPRPPVEPTLAPRTLEEQALGVVGTFRACADVSGSGEGVSDAENDARWEDLAGYFYWFALDSPPKSCAELYASTGIPGRPELLARYEVPRGRANKQRLADRILAELPNLLRNAMERSRGRKGSPVLEDARALLGRVRPGERAVLLVQSDFEQQSREFPTMDFAGSQRGWAHAEQVLGKPQCAPGKVIAVHAQTKPGQLAGRVDALLSTFRRYAQHWGAPEIATTEVTGR